MKIIALTGGIGSGKSAVSAIFQKLDVPIIDTDILARKVVEQGQAGYIEIVKVFGDSILTKDKDIDRQALRKLIFSSDDERLKLEKILHPLIWDKVNQELAQLSATYCIVVVPLLFETKPTQVKFDRILVIDAPDESRALRIIERDSINNEEVQAVFASQVSRDYRLKHADDVISNNSNFKALESSVKQLHQEYLKHFS